MQESLDFPPVPTAAAATTATQLHFPEHERLTCPRCESTNTKFCYFNNYNLSQPRHFCKSCKRYWTKGGSLRNIPVGGTTRKPNKRSNPPAKKLESVVLERGQQNPDRPLAEERGGSGPAAQSDLGSEHQDGRCDVDSLITTTRFL